MKPNDADTRGLVKYLVNNRKHATYWESTRDTADNLLRPDMVVKLPNGRNIVIDAKTNTMVVRDTADAIALTERLVAANDLPD